jgi:hypothetical protein
MSLQTIIPDIIQYKRTFPTSEIVIIFSVTENIRSQAYLSTSLFNCATKTQDV